MSQVHVGDVGTVIEVTLRDEDNKIVNVANALTKKMSFRAPDGRSVIEKDAALVTTGVDGRISYTTIDGDTVLNVAGRWVVQVFVTFPSGAWHTDSSPVDVAGNL
jgi:hypothetical protein